LPPIGWLSTVRSAPVEHLPAVLLGGQALGFQLGQGQLAPAGYCGMVRTEHDGPVGELVAPQHAPILDSADRAPT